MSLEIQQETQKEEDPQGRKIIIFVGPEGSGKSTQGKLLAKELGKPFISTGDIIRERAKNDPGELGEACRVMISKHTYLAPKLIQQILIDRLTQEDASEGVVIDGALRTLEETEEFDKTLSEAGKAGFEVDVIFLDLDPEIGIQRRLKSSERRPGETRETILRRLGKFNTNLEQRMKIVRERYNFFKMDASRTPSEVHEEVKGALNKDE